MFEWAVVFFVTAALAAVFGFTGLATAVAGPAQVVFAVALVLTVVSLIAGRARHPAARAP